VGLHTNGYSLARKLLFEVAGYTAETEIAELGCGAAQELLKPHRSYLGALDGLLESGVIKGLAHITGGGLLENIPRILPEGTAVEITARSWPVLPVFHVLAKIGRVDAAEMHRTFNMGIGMVVIAGADQADLVRTHLDSQGHAYYDIGRVVEGNRSVSILDTSEVA